MNSFPSYEVGTSVFSFVRKQKYREDKYFSQGCCKLMKVYGEVKVQDRDDESKTNNRPWSKILTYLI